MGLQPKEDASPPPDASSSESCSKFSQLLAAAAVQGLGSESKQFIPKAELW